MSLQVDDMSSLLPHSGTAEEQAIRGEDWMSDRSFRANQGQSLMEGFDGPFHSSIVHDSMGDSDLPSAQGIIIETWQALCFLHSVIFRSITNWLSPIGTGKKGRPRYQRYLVLSTSS